MASCKDCVHVEVCASFANMIFDAFNVSEDDAQCLLEKCTGDASVCKNFADCSRFAELNIAKKIKHTPDIDKMREFHKLGLGKGMSERSIFWTCSNCKVWVSLAHKFCPNCGAKFEAEQALKERE